MSFELSQEEGKLLIQLARKAIAEYLKNRKHVSIPENLPEKLKQPCGVFVTISSIEHGEKELRGCIGYPYPTEPLAEAVVESAVHASTQDPRFDPLSLGELGHIVLEISVLTPPQKIEVQNPKDHPTKIRIGQDGLIVEKGVFKGLLLPQVPVEWGWNEEEFLCQCCIKAGLPADTWLLKGTNVYKFQAIIFEEDRPDGEMHRKTLGGN